MKKLYTLLLIGCILLGMAGCQSSGQASSDADKVQALKNRVQYVRTEGAASLIGDSQVIIIRSLQELTQYIADNNGTEIIISEQAVPQSALHKACEKYDEVFFDDNYLVFILLKQQDGSIYHEVIDAAINDQNQLTVNMVTRTTEEVTDTRPCQILLEMSRDQMVASAEDVLVYLEGKALLQGKITEVPPEAQLLMPPAANLVTINGEIPLHTGGYSWYHTTEQGFLEATIADQTCRPVPAERLKPIALADNATVTLNWQVTPTSVTYTCWSDTIWQDADTDAEEVTAQGVTGFTAKTGAYVYEIVATWKDPAADYSGTVHYYAYILCGDGISPAVGTGTQVKETKSSSESALTLYTKDAIYIFDNEHSAALLQMLRQLSYNPTLVCRCLPPVTATFATGESFGLLPGDPAARCSQGQIDLTEEQLALVNSVIKWAKSTHEKYTIAK